MGVADRSSTYVVFAEIRKYRLFETISVFNAGNRYRYELRLGVLECWRTIVHLGHVKPTGKTP